jgi:hypothetical protein
MAVRLPRTSLNQQGIEKVKENSNFDWILDT